MFLLWESFLKEMDVSDSKKKKGQATNPTLRGVKSLAFLTILLFSVWFAGIPGWEETCLTEHPPTQGVLSQQKGAWESVGTVSATWTSLCSASEVTEPYREE